MATWKDVGDWVENHAGAGAALVGSLVTGNVPGAVAAGVSMISSATGHNNPDRALDRLRAPGEEALAKLQQQAHVNAPEIRAHLEAMERMRIEDEQAKHAETQKTIRAGDNAESIWIRLQRPAMAWATLIVALLLISLAKETPSMELITLLLSPAWAYMGLRQVDKSVNAFTGRKQ